MAEGKIKHRSGDLRRPVLNDGTIVYAGDNRAPGAESGDRYGAIGPTSASVTRP
jgi:hypothetical protein